MGRGVLYLVAVMDGATRKAHAGGLSNSLDAEFCIQALEEALARYGAPEIFNTDQGSQFTSPRFVDVLKDAGVRVSMDDHGRWMEKVFIKRLRRRLNRVPLLPRFRDRIGTAGRPDPLDWPLQHQPASLGPCRGHPR